MKLPSIGLVFSLFLSLGLLGLACANGDTVSGGTGSPTGSPSGNAGTTGSGNSSGTAGTSGSGNRAGTTGSGNASGQAGTTGAGNRAGTTGTGNVSGQAGTTGTGNVTGQAGTTGTGNTTGTAGTTGTTGTCNSGNSVAPVTPLITDFSDTMPSSSSAGDFIFGATSGTLGGTSRFESSSSTKGSLAVTGGALVFTGTVAAPTTADMYPYNGFVVYTNGPACLKASAYTGVTFKLTITGTCGVVFSFGDSEHTMASKDPDRGSCAGTSCYASQYTVTSATTSVLFGATPSNAGMPVATVDSNKLTGVQWQMQPASGATTSCSGTVTVDDIKFM